MSCFVFLSWKLKKLIARYGIRTFNSPSTFIFFKMKTVLAKEKTLNLGLNGFFWIFFGMEFEKPLPYLK